MDDTHAHDIRRRRRDFIRAHHPDRGGGTDAFVAGLRAFVDAGGEQSPGPLPRVVIVRQRAWLLRLAMAAVRRLRHDARPPRVR
jgi:hypothetical protein